MSVELWVFLNEAELPTRENWQQAIRDAGYDFTFDEFSPVEHTGFLPIRLNGQECGFEYWFYPAEDTELEDLNSIAAFRTHVATFIFHSSETDMRAAMIAGAFLADLANGVFFDPQSGAHTIGKAAHRMMEAEENAERERMIAQAEKNGRM